MVSVNYWLNSITQKIIKYFLFSKYYDVWERHINKNCESKIFPVVIVIVLTLCLIIMSFIRVGDQCFYC